MGSINKIISARAAFQSAEMKDLLYPISEEEKKRLQTVVLDMYKDILAVCEDINTVPFLVGGSALGAIRHEGFIPWDDDLDIAMMRDEYEHFIDVFSVRYSEKYTVNSAGRDNNSKARFTKILKKGTVLRELLSPKDNSLNGIFVDIFPIDNVPNNYFRRLLKGNYCNFIEFVSSQVLYMEVADDDDIELLKRTGKASYYTRKIVGKLFSFKKSSKWFETLDKVERWKDYNSKYCSIVPGRKHYFGEIIDRNIIMPPRYVKFCDIEAPVFHEVEKYLSNMYGDYMSIPPVEKREVHMVKELKFEDV